MGKNFLLFSFSMKKYQLWLERKTYSQHLNNLMRIKLQSSETKVQGKMSRGLPRSTSKPHETSQSKDPTSFFLSSRDLSYIITTRQLQKHKLRLVRSNQIVRENQQLVKRLNKIKPFVSNTRPMDSSSYKLKRKMQRMNEQQNYDLKDQNYKQFQKTYNQNAKISHKYQLTITVQELDQRVTTHPFAEVCLEILAPHSIGKSQYIPPSALSGHTFQFTFAEKLPDSMILRVHQHKKLEHSILSQFIVRVPAQGETVHVEQTSKCKIACLAATIGYRKIKPKFWSINLFRV